MKVIILRGLPGSGKDAYMKSLAAVDGLDQRVLVVLGKALVEIAGLPSLPVVFAADRSNTIAADHWRHERSAQGMDRSVHAEIGQQGVRQAKGLADRLLIVAHMLPRVTVVARAKEH